MIDIPHYIIGVNWIALKEVKDFNGITFDLKVLKYALLFKTKNKFIFEELKDFYKLQNLIVLKDFKNTRLLIICYNKESYQKMFMYKPEEFFE